jgi:hypothetical protein
MGEVIARLAESAGNLVVGLAEAADRVEQTRRGYAEQDAAAARAGREFF